MRSVLAAVVTMPGRSVERTLRSLRDQVDRLHVYLNGYRKVPSVVAALADEYRLDPHNTRGSAGKLAWADQWDGLYLGCDDDLAYPGNYVATMRATVAQWSSRAVVTCHGRILRPDARSFHEASFAAHALRSVPEGRWLNYPGGCALAFDTALGVPVLTGKNVEEPLLAVWAQRHEVPIWLQPHTADWLTYLLPPPGDPREPPTIWNEECRTGFVRRNAPLLAFGDSGGTWVVHTPILAAA